MKNSNSYIIAATGSWNSKLFKKNNFAKNFIFVSNSSDLKKKVIRIKPKIIFFIHWNNYVPKNIYSKFICIGFHMTDLPYGRGGSPLQNLILRKHKITKLTAFKINHKIDSGPIYLKYSLSLSGNATQIYKRLTLLSYRMIKKIINDNIFPKEQKGKITNFKRRKPEQSLIKNKISIDEIYDFIRMLDAPGYPKAYFNLKNVKLEFTNIQKSQVGLKAKVEITKK